MSVSASYNLGATINETLELGVDGASNPRVTHSAFNKSGTINATSTVPATKCSVDSIALAAGAKTIDLTALGGTGGATVDGTGLKVQYIQFENPSDNANNMTFSEGAANGYAMLGAAWTMILKPGQVAAFYLNDGAPDVAAADKNIDVAGTAVQPFKLTVVLG